MQRLWEKKKTRFKRLAEKAVSSERIRFLSEQKCEGKSRNELRANALGAPTQPKEKFFKTDFDD